jgi:hypothetical protein
MISAADAFAPLRTALEGAQVRYAIGGSWASTAFGEPRFTNDVDIVADFNRENLERLLALLAAAFFADRASYVLMARLSIGIICTRAPRNWESSSYWSERSATSEHIREANRSPAVRIAGCYT